MLRASFYKNCVCVSVQSCCKSLYARCVPTNWTDAFTNDCASCEILCGLHHNRYCYEQS